jgi:hypothetical protein
MMTLLLINESVRESHDRISFLVFLAENPEHEIQIVVPREVMEKIVPSQTRSMHERFDVHRELFMGLANRYPGINSCTRNSSITLNDV